MTPPPPSPSSARPPSSRIRFHLERFLLRGAQYRLLFIAAVIGLLSVGAGAMVLVFGGVSSLPEATWWAFLRLTDPGYLGDDEGALVRVISTALTVAGYVVFMGSLVAIMTQWLNSTIQRLERGMTPVSRQHHAVILGFTNRTVALVRELLLSEERVRKFLLHRGARAFHVVILVEEVTPQLRQQLRDELGELWDEGRITLRSGSPLRVDHLDRVDILRAGVVILPGSDLVAQDEGAVALDARTVKTLLTLEQAAGERGVADRPLVVAEVHDVRKVSLARRGYRGPAEFIASDAVLSRLMAQNLRHPGLSRVYGELLSQDAGNEIYLPEAEELSGVPVGELDTAFPLGIVLGLVRIDGPQVRPLLNLPPDEVVQAGDRIVVVARRWGDVQAAARRPPSGLPIPGESTAGGTVPAGRAIPVTAATEGDPGPSLPRPRRILVLGWSVKVPALVRELGAYRGESWEVDVFSRVDPARRRGILERHGVGSGVTLRHLEGDFTVHSELLRIGPLDYDGILLLGGDRHRSGGEADARTILGALLLQELAAQKTTPSAILVEILDPENQDLLDRTAAADAGREPPEVLVTPLLVSHVLAQVALRRELRAVFDALFTAGGPEISFVPASSLGLEGRVAMAEVAVAARGSGLTALGVRPHGAPPILNPGNEGVWEAQALHVVVLGIPPGESGSRPRPASGV